MACQSEKRTPTHSLTPGPPPGKWGIYAVRSLGAFARGAMGVASAQRRSSYHDSTWVGWDEEWGADMKLGQAIRAKLPARLGRGITEGLS